MRKLMVGLMMVVGLLAVTPPAMAQSLVVPGSGDPVGLITSGAVLPFLGQGNAPGGTGLSFLELLAPVDFTTVHMFLFDANCVRNGPSINGEGRHDISAIVYSFPIFFCQMTFPVLVFRQCV